MFWYIVACLVSGIGGFFIAALLGAGKVADLEARNWYLDFENSRLREKLKQYRAEEIREDGG
jgi:hypothetical protein